MAVNRKGNFIFFSFLIVIFLSIPGVGHALDLKSKYSSDLNVKLTTIGSINSLSFTFSNEYIATNENVTLHKNIKYDISISSGTLTIKQNGDVIIASNQDIVIKPINQGSLITFNGRSYLGSIKFKISNSSFYLINSLGIEDYLIGVLPGEMGESFPLEALKAQAVASRTYALNCKNNGEYDVTDGISSQVYKGYDASQKKCIQAINETKGEVITYNGNFINAVYSASDGGYTEAAENVWSSSLPYLIARKDDFDAANENCAYYSKIVNYSDSDIDSFIKKRHSDWNDKQFVKIDVNNIKTFESGRISSLPIVFIDSNNTTQTKTIGKEEARSFFDLLSARYMVTSYENSTTGGNIYSFNVKGYGHGVGLSQWGSYYRAINGNQNYKDILNFYYYNTVLQNISSPTTYMTQFDTYIGGIDRYSTSISISNKTFTPSSNAKIQNVVIAVGDNFPDALSGSVLARKYNAPILLVEKTPYTSSSINTIDYINNNVSKDGKVFILGDSTVISEDFEKKFNQIGFNNIVRLGGLDRVDTAIKINNSINASYGTPIVVATGKNFPDALSISPIAASNGWPIFLVRDDIQADFKDYLIKNKPSMIYVIGGSGVISDSMKNQVKSILNYGDDKVVRLGGVSRYETSKIINSTFIKKTNKVVVATGQNFPDALSGSVYAAINTYPIILADSSNSSSAIDYMNYIYNNDVIHIEALGDKGAVDEKTISQLTSLTK